MTKTQTKYMSEYGSTIVGWYPGTPETFITTITNNVLVEWAKVAVRLI